MIMKYLFGCPNNYKYYYSILPTIAAIRTVSLLSSSPHADKKQNAFGYPGAPLCYTPGYKQVAPTELKDNHMLLGFAPAKPL
jgi:hypothetical protein